MGTIMGGSQSIFMACALAGTLVLLIKIALGSLGGGHHGPDGDHHDGHDGHDSESTFKLFSLYSVTGFIMMFGWSGLAALNQFKLGDVGSILVGLTCGGLTMLVTATMLHMTEKFTSQGADFKIEQTVGKTGSVYQKIAPGGKGVIQVTVNGVLRELEAVATDLKEIESFTSVFVERVVDHKTVAVKRIV